MYEYEYYCTAVGPSLTTCPGTISTTAMIGSFGISVNCGPDWLASSTDLQPLPASHLSLDPSPRAFALDNSSSMIQKRTVLCPGLLCASAPQETKNEKRKPSAILDAPLHQKGTNPCTVLYKSRRTAVPRYNAINYHRCTMFWTGCFKCGRSD